VNAFYGYYIVDLFLPDSQHKIAAAVLNSFHPFAVQLQSRAMMRSFVETTSCS
jgi:hypothetical protein